MQTEFRKLRRKRAAAGYESRKIMAHLSENPSERWYPDKSAKDNSANDTSAKPTVRMPTVRKGQQCECQQCECDSGANVSSANATAVRKTILRTVQNLSVSLSFFFLQKLLLLFTSIFYLKMPIAFTKRCESWHTFFLVRRDISHKESS